MIDQREDQMVWPHGPQGRARVVMMREIFYEVTSLISHDGGHDGGNGDDPGGQHEKALSLNISSGGMLLLMARPPGIERAVRVHDPAPVRRASTPTLAEVRWVRSVPFGPHSGLSLVGLRFLL